MLPSSAEAKVGDDSQQMAVMIARANAWAFLMVVLLLGEAKVSCSSAVSTQSEGFSLDVNLSPSGREWLPPRSFPKLLGPVLLAGLERRLEATR